MAIIAIFLIVAFIISNNSTTDNPVVKNSQVMNEIENFPTQIAYIGNEQNDLKVLTHKTPIDRSTVTKMQIDENMYLYETEKDIVIGNIEDQEIEEQEEVDLLDADNIDEEYYIDEEDAYLESKQIGKVDLMQSGEIVFTTSEYEKSIIKLQLETEKSKIKERSSPNHRTSQL